MIGFLVERATGWEQSDAACEILNRGDPVPGRGPWEYLDATVRPDESYTYRIVALAANGKTMRFLPASPHPIVEATTLRFTIPAPTEADLCLYNVAGRQVRSLMQGPASAGVTSIDWDGRDESGRPVPVGIYLARLRAGGDAASQRIVMIRQYGTTPQSSTEVREVVFSVRIASWLICMVRMGRKVGRFDDERR